VFCIRNHTDGVGSASSLWLKQEPELDEIKAAIDDAYPFDGIEEIVFCGYGEPMVRADVVIAIANHIKFITSSFDKGQEKPALPVRINTNGLVFLMWPGFDVGRLSVVDSVSISLNADDSDEYYRLTRPKYTEGAFESLLCFAREAIEYTSVTLSVISGTLSDERLENCKRIANSLGVPLKIRGME